MLISYTEKKLDKGGFHNSRLMNNPKKNVWNESNFYLLFLTLPFCMVLRRSFFQMLCLHTILTLHCGSSIRSVPSHKMLTFLQLLFPYSSSSTLLICRSCEEKNLLN